MSNTLRGRVAVVTGASSGIGRATALALAGRGMAVALAARRADLLEAVAAEVEANGGRALVVPTDVERRDQVAALVESTLDRWGRVDVLVANAGIYVRRRVVDLDADDVERSMAVNFYGTLYPILEVLPHMLDRGSGHLVVVSSMDGKKAIPLDAPYVVAKFALAGLADVMRQELAEHGIAVTGVFPGRVDTPFVSHLRFPRISPKMPVRSVADAIVRAVVRPRPEVVMPVHARALILLNALAPGLADRAVRLFHLEGWEAEAVG